MKNRSFSILNTELTNEPITVIYRPSSTTSSYSYKVYKNNSIYDEGTVSTLKQYSFYLEESGEYYIEITTQNKNGKTEVDKSGTYKLDVDAPKIISPSTIKMLRLDKKETFSLDKFKGEIRVIDNRDGDLFKSLNCDMSGADFYKAGISKISCTVSDEAGNVASKDITFNITENYTKQFNAIIAFIGLLIFIFMIFYVRFKRAMRIEKKLLPYVTEPINDKGLSLFGEVSKIFHSSIKRLNNILKKSSILSKYSKKYEKYIPISSKEYNEGMDFVSTKFFISILLLFISLLAHIIRYQLFSSYELIIPIVFGFFLPDIIYFLKYKLYQNRLENDLLQAIIIMNNAFKSGRSITQAIELVTKELDGPIGLEFKKMHLELSFGLSIEEVFKRLSERLQMEEVTYLTASLSILNKTGGNIIKVFSSIEKTLFNKKKLKIELASLTGSSKIIVYVLSLVPFFFILLMSLISPTYFEPLYTTNLGFVFIGLMLAIYLIYLWLVRKIMKVRM